MIVDDTNLMRRNASKESRNFKPRNLKKKVDKDKRDEITNDGHGNEISTEKLITQIVEDMSDGRLARKVIEM